VTAPAIAVEKLVPVSKSIVTAPLVPVALYSSITPESKVVTFVNRLSAKSLAKLIVVYLALLYLEDVPIDRVM